MTTQEIKLPEALDLSSASTLAAALNNAKGHDLCLDASEVSRLGGQGLQLLIAANAAWDEGGHSFTINNRSEAFTESLKILGFDANTFAEVESE